MITENWYCIYTKPKAEHLVSLHLLNIPGIEVFSPQIKRTKTVRGRLKTLPEELFPCYIFSRFDPAAYQHMITYTRGVRKIIGDASGNPYIVENSIIETIKSRVRDGFIHMERYEDNYNEGDVVVFRDGPMKGLTGIFQKDLTARDRVMILLSTITYQARIETEKRFIARA